MKLSYYPGCTLKTKAQNLESAAVASLASLGIEATELERWNCCGAVFSLADDDLIHQVAPVRTLIRAKEAGSDTLLTLCSQCYNTLARANHLVRNDEEKLKTLNLFMDEEIDYDGEVEVVHLLQLLRDQVGWEALRAKVKKPLEGMKIAPFYGCTLLRPNAVTIDDEATILSDLLSALGATPIPFAGTTDCCGAYEVLVHPEAATRQAASVLRAAREAGAEALVLSCPLCDYNLGHRQRAIADIHPDIGEMPVYYLSQLLAVALDVEPERNRFDLNNQAAQTFAQSFTESFT